MCPEVTINGELIRDLQTLVVNSGDDVVLGMFVPDALSRGKWEWSDGSTASTLPLGPVTTSGEYTVRYTYAGETTTYLYRVYVRPIAPTTMVTTLSAIAIPTPISPRQAKRRRWLH